VSAISQKSATAARRAAQNWPSVHCGKSARGPRWRALADRNDEVARRSGAIDVPRLELVNDTRQRESATLDEEQQVIEKISGFGNKLAIVVHDRGQGDLDAFLGNLLRNP
jgi:hypothetical protein